MKAKPIPRDLKAGDIIVDNHGERHIVLEYHDDGDIDCGWAIFRPDGHRWKTTDGFAVKIIRKTSKPKKDADERRRSCEMNKHDPIQHLRELLAKHRGLKPAWNNYGSAALFERNQVQAITAITNALPALLAVAEAARAYMQIRYPNGDLATTTTWAVEMDRRAVVLLDALAKLDEVKLP